MIVLGLVILLVLFLTHAFARTNVHTLSYSQFVHDVKSKQIASATYNNENATITGTLANGQSYSTTASNPLPTSLQDEMLKDGVKLNFATPPSNLLTDLVIYVLPFVAIFGIFVWLNRRAQGQMSGIMSIGRSRAKLYTTERPRTTFNDVAGYQGVKQEISEVVDFLKNSGRFRDIGARVPKGVLLVGPPGTGKTLLARAVAGEAGVPFLSVSGSDFMEMFVGVGASRVRDLFQTARKQAPAIIFVDEIDSIGRKRGAGLGGGHDEREQTLNQMLSEMDGFDPAEGIVIMAATNRPDILDPALLRPGRFDRQIVVPLPDLEERLPILQVHCRDKRVGPDVDLMIVARGTPGMSGAELANLVNESALHAVRRGSPYIEMRDFDAARDRVLMGQRRDSMVLSEDEKERVAFHEGGHAVLAYVLPHADPLLKVSIIPTGMALGVTQQLPAEELHISRKEYIEDSLAVRMGGRVAEKLVYDGLSTGASDDLQRNTELARKMVREWGMSDRIGPMAWGSQGQVFLGEDLMHTRDYSEDTSRVVDEEVERILRTQELRADKLLKEHRAGLEAVARALLEHETVDGAEIARLVDAAYGRPVHGAEGKPGSEAERYAPSLTGGSASPIIPPPQHEPAPQGAPHPQGPPPPWAADGEGSRPPAPPYAPPANNSGPEGPPDR
ncbi:MAG TPA: ATP-dependent zinc metalloprotease FtsH [Acidimicrobiales bacterium]|nr:ATP-dependent zinc metalloprotease FtsH [Acidimicrobiales bacterium]